MSPLRESSSPFKSCKLFAFSKDKPCDFFTKFALTIAIITTISLVLISSFLSQQTHWTPSPIIPKSLNISGQNIEEAPAPAAISHILFGIGGSIATNISLNISGQNIEEAAAATNISHILFGIGGSIATWTSRSRYTELWWNPKSTRGFVWLDKKPKIKWSSSWPPFHVSDENWTRFKYSSSQSAVRIARIVLESFKLGLPNVRWFVMGDDDTVFFTHNLVSVLAKYDHRQMYYIGDNSESVEQNVMHSYDMGFGGGGFAISYALAAELVKVLDGCINRYYTFYGSDQRVWACLSEIGVSLTKEPGFHQFDIRGDPYGLLAAHPVAPLVSLHHLDALKPIFPTKTRFKSLELLIRASQVDPARIIQQSFCHDYKRNRTVSIAWGYTAQLYPALVPAKDLNCPMQTFQTWRTWSNGPFTFNTRPMIPNSCEHPVRYFLDRVENVGKDKTQTQSSYRRFVDKSMKMCYRSPYAHAFGVERVIVTATKMDPEDWNKAPRRQCCEIMDGWSIMYRTLRVKIRRCDSS